jgi:hypothetical protein
MEESGSVHMIDQIDQRSPESVDIGQNQRFAMSADLYPGHVLDRFLEGAETARERYKGVGMLEHQAFPLVHVLRDDELAADRHRNLAVTQEPRDDAEDLSPIGEDLAGDHTHQPNGTAAIDQTNSLGGERSAELASGVRMDGVVSRRRATVDANAFQSHAP